MGDEVSSRCPKGCKQDNGSRLLDNVENGFVEGATLAYEINSRPLSPDSSHRHYR